MRDTDDNGRRCASRMLRLADAPVHQPPAEKPVDGAHPLAYETGSMRDGLVALGSVVWVVLACGASEQKTEAPNTPSCRALAACCAAASEGVRATCEAAVSADADESCSLLLEHLITSEGCGSGGAGTGGAPGSAGTGAGGHTSPARVIGTCENAALDGIAQAETTYPGYSPSNAIDGDRTTELIETASWASNWRPPEISLPQWFEIHLPEPRRMARIEVYTTQSYPIQDYDVLTGDGTSWQPLLEITGNTATHRTHEFPPVTAKALRVLARRGPAHQVFHVRLNEIEIYAGTAAQCP